MIFVWKGKGLWVLHLLTAVLVTGIALDVLEKNMGLALKSHIREAMGLSRFFGLMLVAVAGVPCIVMGVREHMRGVREVLEPESGRIVRRRPSHSLWFINVYWWGLMICAAGLALAFA